MFVDNDNIFLFVCLFGFVLQSTQFKMQCFYLTFKLVMDPFASTVLYSTFEYCCCKCFARNLYYIKVNILRTILKLVPGKK